MQNFVKVSKIALAVATAFVANAAVAAPVDIYISGASALRNTMPRLMDRYCQAASVATPRSIHTFGTSVTSSSNGANRRAYACTFRTAGSAEGDEIPAALQGKEVVVHHSVEPGVSATLNNLVGGSITGIVPLLPGNSAVVQFTNATGSTTGATDTAAGAGFVGATIYTGATETSATAGSDVKPDLGISDIEPKLFAAEYLNLPTDPAAIAAGWELNGQDPAALENVVAFNQGFGIIASQNLVTAGLTSISMDQLAAVLSGEVANWNQIGGPNLPVRVCRRTPGSGTQATFNALINKVGCGASFTNLGITPGDAAGYANVSENATSGAVTACVIAAHDAGTEGAIGLLGLDTNGANAKYKHLAINGEVIWSNTAGVDSVDGEVDNILEQKLESGLYPLLVESIVAKSAAKTLSDEANAFYTLLAERSGVPLFTDKLPGVVAPSATKFTRSGDTCNQLTFKP